MLTFPFTSPLLLVRIYNQNLKPLTLLFKISANILALICGIASTWSSPVLTKLKDENNLDENPFGEVISTEAESWIGSLLSLGAVLGPIPFGLLSDKIGRKLTLLILATPLLVSFILLAFSKLIILYYISRFMAGVAVGGSFTILPMYTAEIAEVFNRGILTSFFNGSLVLGMLVAYVVGPYVHLKVFNLICACFVVAFIVLFIILCPESPTYLVAINKPEVARQALERIRIRDSAKEIENEMLEIKTEAENNAQGSLKDFFNNKGLIKALAIAMMLIFFQPGSGCDVVQFYTQPIFEETGSDIPSDIASIIIGIVQVLSALIAPFFVDCAGRKSLLILSALVMVLGEAPLGVFFYLNSETDTDTTSIQWLPVLCLILYVVGFNYGFGPLPWTIVGEIFPSHVKTMACGITTSFVFMVSFVTTKFFLTISEEISTGGAFWIFAGLSFLAGVCVMLFVPETKGKTFSQIQKEFKM